jgi:hypothetical protein
MLSTFIAYSTMATLHYYCIWFIIKAYTTVFLIYANTLSKVIGNRIAVGLIIINNAVNCFSSFYSKILTHKSLLSCACSNSSFVLLLLLNFMGCVQFLGILFVNLLVIKLKEVLVIFILRGFMFMFILLLSLLIK